MRLLHFKIILQRHLQFTLEHPLRPPRTSYPRHVRYESITCHFITESISQFLSLTFDNQLLLSAHRHTHLHDSHITRQDPSSLRLSDEHWRRTGVSKWKWSECSNIEKKQLAQHYVVCKSHRIAYPSISTQANNRFSILLYDLDFGFLVC